jgi:hypothetical protein
LTIYPPDARQQISTFLDAAMKGPDFWSERLATLDYRGFALADIAASPRTTRASPGTRPARLSLATSGPRPASGS